MITPNTLRQAYEDAGQLVSGHDPVRDKPLPKGYPNGLNPLSADHVADIVRNRVLRPIERCHTWLAAKIEATAVENIDVPEFEEVVAALTNAIDGLRHATNDNRDSVVEAIDRELHELHGMLGHFVS
jgi:hypothetical protein